MYVNCAPPMKILGKLFDINICVFAGIMVDFSNYTKLQIQVGYCVCTSNSDFACMMYCVSLTIV